MVLYLNSGPTIQYLQPMINLVEDAAQLLRTVLRVHQDERLPGQGYHRPRFTKCNRTKMMYIITIYIVQLFSGQEVLFDSFPAIRTLQRFTSAIYTVANSHTVLSMTIGHIIIDIL